MSTTHGGHVISQMDPGQQLEKTIDREKDRHNSVGEYNRGGVPPNELQIYTWLDCTLRELMNLIKDVNPEARRRGTEFNFSVVAPDRYASRYTMRDAGITVSGQRSPDDNKTLSQCKFEVGDYVDVLISPPSANVVGAIGGGGGGPIGVGGGRGRGPPLPIVDRSGPGPRGRY